MDALRLLAFSLLCFTFVFTGVPARAQRPSTPPDTQSRRAVPSDSLLTGVYRVDPASSDKLYSVVESASSSLPFREQQRFFIDLAVRLTPPDLLAIERKGRMISLASSRAPRISFEADGVTQRERAADGRMVRTRALVSGASLTVSASGGTEDSFTVIFEPIDDGRRLRVTRSIYAAQLNEPVVVRSVYDKISDLARWDVYGEPQRRPTGETASASSRIVAAGAGGAALEAEALRASLEEWIGATNARDLGKLIQFYLPEVRAFYLARNVPRSFVRAERARAFNEADAITVRAEDPEIILNGGGRIAVMRFRKQYSTMVRGRRRQGEVVQELRWQKTAGGWRIFSERDVRVIR